ncbi:MAG: hypothetical protein KatS3mg040_0415 [Candidatus Kapaibacterium sp.]|nr:MAG: hypothetical protein KatS3mg040_0415 [Candidatus Kapabacteria bacterium]
MATQCTPRHEAIFSSLLFSSLVRSAKTVVELIWSTSNESVPCLDGHRAALYCSG